MNLHRVVIDFLECSSTEIGDNSTDAKPKNTNISLRLWEYHSVLISETKTLDVKKKNGLNRFNNKSIAIKT